VDLDERFAERKLGIWSRWRLNGGRCGSCGSCWMGLLCIRFYLTAFEIYG
jgi:hypothetical protein